MRKSLTFEVAESLDQLRSLLKAETDPLRKARLHALYLHKLGTYRYRKDIAEAVGYGRNAVGRWFSAYETGGLPALLHVGISGAKDRPLGLSSEAIAGLKSRLSDPQENFGSYTEAYQWAKETYEITISYRWFHKLLHNRMGAKLKVARKSNVRKDPQKEADFKKNSAQC